MTPIRSIEPQPVRPAYGPQQAQPQLAIHPQLRQNPATGIRPLPQQTGLPKLALKPVVSQGLKSLQPPQQNNSSPPILQPRPLPRLGTSSSSSSPPPSKSGLVKIEEDMDSSSMLSQNSSMSYSLGVAPEITSIVTSKEWVLPPRPKPGRKPSNDLPPTKRKAQNRAAQRAFRERRAARVIELEDKLQEVEQEHDEVENDLRAALQNANTENNKLRAVIEELRSEVEMLRALKSQDPRESLYGFVDANPLAAVRGTSMFPMSQRARQQREMEKERKSDTDNDNSQKKPVSILPKARPPKKKETVSQVAKSVTADITPMKPDEEPDDCGLCETGGSCLCDTLGLKAPLPPEDTNTYIVDGINFNEIKPIAAVPLKKRPASNGTSMMIRKRFKRVSEANEIDFTKTFGSRPATPPVAEPVHTHGADCKHSKTPTSKLSQTPSISTLNSPVDSNFVDNPSPQVDPCGFCSNGTPCLCAGLDEEEGADKLNGKNCSDQPQGRKHGPDVIEIIDDDDQMTGNDIVKNSSVTKADNDPCACAEDPKANLFCTVLKTSGRPCDPSSTPVLMKCTDAYNILSRHPNFANCSIGSLVSLLRVRNDKIDVDSLYAALGSLDK